MIKRWIIRLVMLSGIAALFAAGQAHAAKIMLINSYDMSYAWSRNLVAGVLEGLGDGHDILQHHMDTKRLPVDHHGDATDKALSAFTDFDPDLVILLDDNALRYLGNHLHKMGKPIAYAGINGDPQDYFDEAMPARVSGVLERVPFGRSMITMNRVMQCGFSIQVIMDRSITSDKMLATSFGGRDEFRIRDLDIMVTRVNTRADLVDVLKNAGAYGYGCIYMASYGAIHLPDGDVMSTAEVYDDAWKHSGLPILTGVSNSVGADGAAAGLVLDTRRHGMRAASLGLRLLAGDKPGFMHDTGAALLMFSRAGMARAGLPLPSDLTQDINIVP